MNCYTKIRGAKPEGEEIKVDNDDALKGGTPTSKFSQMIDMGSHEEEEHNLNIQKSCFIIGYEKGSWLVNQSRELLTQDISSLSKHEPERTDGKFMNMLCQWLQTIIVLSVVFGLFFTNIGKIGLLKQ